MRNVARNWNRTGMIILSMAIASAMMTLTLAFASGYAVGVDLPWRQMVGADIVVYPNRFVFAGQSQPDEAWQWRYPDPDQPTDALWFHPSLAAGYLSPADAPPAVLDLRALPAGLGSIEGVAAIEPARMMRAYLVTENPDGTTTRAAVTLRGRDITDDMGHYGIDGSVYGGRYFRPTQDGEWVALVNAPGLGSLAPRAGSRLVVEVPTSGGMDSDQRPVLDYSRLRPYYFLLYGEVRLSLGNAALRDALPADQARESRNRGALPSWPVYVDAPEVWVPSATFDKIYQEVTGQPLRFVQELWVKVTDMSLAKSIAADLGSRLPECAVLTVPQEVSLSGIHYEATLTSLEPMVVNVVRVQYERSSLALDVKSELALAAFAVAGLLVIANMYILVTQRRREIGILKALGATGRDILVLFLTEALGYAVIGSLLGFGCIRLLTLASIFSSQTSMVEGAFLTLKAFGSVAGLTLGIALIFGFIPAWEAARTPSASLIGEA